MKITIVVVAVTAAASRVAVHYVDLFLGGASNNGGFHSDNDSKWQQNWTGNTIWRDT